MAAGWVSEQLILQIDGNFISTNDSTMSHIPSGRMHYLRIRSIGPDCAHSLRWAPLGSDDGEFSPSNVYFETLKSHRDQEVAVSREKAEMQRNVSCLCG
eukprot:6190252-Pleurochrysis_carterae.AAC.1